MTYASAWKTDKEVFLAADSAVTTTGETVDSLDVDTSSFGREHFLEVVEGRRVEERVVKIFSDNKLGVAFAGSYIHAHAIAKDIFAEIQSGKSPREALDVALFKNIIPQDRTVQLAMAYYDNGPKIINFNSREGNVIHDDQDLVQMGNPPEEFQRRAQNWIADIKNDGHISNEHLTLILGILQSYDLLNNIIEIGIGGAFTGLYVNESGLNWQPDILFIEYSGERDKHVGTCFRHDCLVISSPTIGQSRCFTSTFLPLDSSVLHGKVNKAIQKARKLKANAEYEYVVIMSHNNNSLTVIEMKRNKRHALLWLDTFEDGERTGISTAFFPKLKSLLNDERDNGLTYIQYRKPDIKSIPEDKKTQRVIDYE
jgi:hypothetical protein